MSEKKQHQGPVHIPTGRNKGDGSLSCTIEIIRECDYSVMLEEMRTKE